MSRDTDHAVTFHVSTTQSRWMTPFPAVTAERTKTLQPFCLNRQIMNNAILQNWTNTIKI